MSASDADSKIDVLDAPDVVRRKLRKAFAEPKKVEDNGLISFIKYVLLPSGALRHGSPYFKAESQDGEPLIYHDIETLEKDYAKDTIGPKELKAAISEALIELLTPIQKAFQESKEWQENEKKAYPPTEEKKKVKKVKDKGKFHPGSHKGQVPNPPQMDGVTADEMEKLKIETV